MKILKHMCIWGYCLILTACYSSRNSNATNPYLTHYLSPASDSTTTGSGKALPSRVDEHNQERLHEKVDPEGEESWADILRNILIYYQVGR